MIVEERRIITDDKTIYLSVIESKILSLLLKNKGKIVTYEKLIEEIYCDKFDDSYKRSATKNMSLLRKKIKEIIKIRTVTGKGYIIEEERN